MNGPRPPDWRARYAARGQLHEILRVTEWRGGGVYRTAPAGFVIGPRSCLRPVRGIEICAPSTTLTLALHGSRA